MSEATLLRKAADELDRIGWIQGDEYSSEGACVLGALMNVDDNSGNIINAELAMMRFVDERHGLDHWNDAPGRTHAEVVATLRACADKLSAVSPAGAPQGEPQ